MDLNEIHTRIAEAINKTTGQYFTRSEIDNYLDQAQIDELSLLIENSRELPETRISLGRTATIDNDLNPFLEKASLATPDADNIHDIPTNFLHPWALLNGNFPIKVLSPDKLGSTLNSTIIAPSASYPRAMFVGETSGVTRLQIFPSTLTSAITLYYIRRPAAPRYATTGSGRTAAYDQENSTQMEWSDRAILRIIKRALAKMGVTVDDYNFAQYNEQKQQTGQ